MAIPQVAAATALLKKIKWVIVLLVFLGWSLACYTFGQRSILKPLAQGESKAVAKERERGSEAVKAATRDVARIKDLETDNARLTRKLEEMADRPLCPIDDDSLRLLEEVQRSTK